MSATPFSQRLTYFEVRTFIPGAPLRNKNRLCSDKIRLKCVFTIGTDHWSYIFIQNYSFNTQYQLFLKVY